MNADALNSTFLIGVLCAASLSTMLVQANDHSSLVFERTAAVGTSETSTSSSGVLIDIRKQVVPIRAYQRVVSLSMVADPILLELLEPGRLVAITKYTHDNSPLAYRFAKIPKIADSKELEPVINLEPDLVVVSRFADETYMARLRERGIAVFDIGDMRGVQSTVAAVRSLSALVGRPERGSRIANRYMRNLQALEAAVAGRPRPSGIYLTMLGDLLFGGTVGSSYGDLLHYGGVDDLAAQHGFVGWPRYSPEQLLSIDPKLIVTAPQRRNLICDHTILSRLSACRGEGRIVELPNKNASDPGLGLVEVAQDLQFLIHGVHPSLSSK